MTFPFSSVVLQRAKGGGTYWGSLCMRKDDADFVGCVVDGECGDGASGRWNWSGSRCAEGSHGKGWGCATRR